MHFSEFACDPEDIRRTLQIQPDEVGRKGEVRIARGSRDPVPLQ